MSKKPIIVFEGVECCGKTHHISLVSKYLLKKKISHLKIREPGGCSSSEKIRKLILNKKSNFHKNTDLLLYLASRNENINKMIRKYQNKKIILIDRFIDSTIAYQHYGMGVNLNLIKNINKVILRGIKVDFTFLNYVSNKNMKKRLLKRKNLNRYDRFNMKFYQKVQLGYFKISKQNKSKYFLVNSNLSINENKKNIIKKINKLI